jgi:hypothetical protein
MLSRLADGRWPFLPLPHTFNNTRAGSIIVPIDTLASSLWRAHRCIYRTAHLPAARVGSTDLAAYTHPAPKPQVRIPTRRGERRKLPPT